MNRQLLSIICILLWTFFLQASAYGQNIPSDTTVYEKVDVKAVYTGSWLDHVQRTINMSVPINQGAPDGRYTVLIGFVVNTDGSLTNFTKLSNHGYGMEEETIRMIRKSKKWKPATIDGQAVRYYRNQPFTFLIRRP